MRLVLVAVFLAGGAAAQPQWELLAGSPYNAYRTEDLSFVDPDHGWGVDGDGRVHRTADGGETWAQTATLPVYLRSVAFVTPRRGWVGTIGTDGPDRKLFETRNGGLTFNDISWRIAGGTHGICSLSAVDEQTVYGAGTYDGPATLVKTTDGGGTWAAIPLAPYLDTAIDVHFFDADRGVVVGGTGNYVAGSIRPRVIRTEDGGQTWTAVYTGTVAPGWGWKLSFPTPDVGYASVEKYDRDGTSIVLKTVDGGRTWAELRFEGGTGNMQGVGFLTPAVGWVSGRGATMQTFDGGETWAPVTEGGGLDTNVNRFVFLDSGLGFASGHRIHRVDARATLAEAGPDADGALRVGPNPARDVVRVWYAPTAPRPATIEVVDAIGRRVGSWVDAAGDGATTWAVPPGLAPGVYTVRSWTAAGVSTRPVVIVR